MQKTLIQFLNGTMVVLILIGLPAITSIQVGSLQIASKPAWQNLSLYGWTFAVLLNLLGTIAIAQGKPARSLCLKWLCIHSAFLAIHFSLFAGWIHFDWLKRFLLWLKNS